MKMDVLESMSPAQLRHYLEFFLHHYRVLDAFWFIYVTERFGQPAAEQVNQQVWGRVSGLAAKDILTRFDIREKGLRGFLQAYRLFPWSLLIDYQIEERPGELILSVAHCPPQQARLKRGLGEYVCQHMHRAEFVSFAQAVDERICVQCLFAPPDPHPQEMFCRWRFWLEETPAPSAPKAASAPP
jgi:hypothetical protein